MELNSRIHKFLSYIGEPVTNEYVGNFYLMNDIKHERVHLFKDFTLSLMKLIMTTYMGDDVTTTSEQTNHFNWCWNKNINNFKLEGINFENKELYNYFLIFTEDIFYSIPDKDNPELRDNIFLLWDILFTYTSKKTEPDLEMLLKL